MEHHAGHADVADDALREAEEEVGDECERRRGERGQVPHEGLAEQRRGAQERREERVQEERVRGLHTLGQVQVAREHERHEADARREWERGCGWNRPRRQDARRRRWP